MMMLVSGTTRRAASSTSSGIFPTGHRSNSSALDAGSAKSTVRATNGVPFS